MGKHNFPKYVVIFDGKTDKAFTWRVTEHGHTDAKNLEAFVISYIKSLETGGEHPRYAEIRHNFRGGATVAEWHAETIKEKAKGANRGH